MQRGFYFEAERCVGCLTCITACKNWNDVEPKVTDEPGTKGPKWRWVLDVESGAYPRATIKSFSLSCMHCGNAPCAAICPVGAITKRPEDGIVVVDKEKCVKCQACFHACPFGVPQYDSEGTMEKCNYCLDRVESGQDPACVASCPAKAIKAGTMEELTEYARGKTVLKLSASANPNPSVLVIK